MNSESCAMCGKPEQYHKDSGTRHPFTPEGMSPTLDFLKTDEKKNPAIPELGFQPDAGSSVHHSALPFDPVLRQALINKGVLSPQDIRDAEDYIKALGGALNNANP